MKLVLGEMTYVSDPGLKTTCQNDVFFFLFSSQDETHLGFHVNTGCKQAPITSEGAYMNWLPDQGTTSLGNE